MRNGMEPGNMYGLPGVGELVGFGSWGLRFV